MCLSASFLFTSCEEKETPTDSLSFPGLSYTLINGWKGEDVSVVSNQLLRMGFTMITQFGNEEKNLEVWFSKNYNTSLTEYFCSLEANENSKVTTVYMASKASGDLYSVVDAFTQLEQEAHQLFASENVNSGYGYLDREYCEEIDSTQTFDNYAALEAALQDLNGCFFYVHGLWDQGHSTHRTQTDFIYNNDGSSPPSIDLIIHL
jgi:hypothetical protein